MKDVIKELVDIDEKAKAYSEETAQLKITLEAEIEEEVQKIRDKYAAQAENDVKVEKEKIEEEAKRRFEKNEAKRREASEKLRKKFDENVDGWVEQIVGDVLK